MFRVALALLARVGRLLVLLVESEPVYRFR